MALAKMTDFWLKPYCFEHLEPPAEAGGYSINFTLKLDITIDYILKKLLFSAL